MSKLAKPLIPSLGGAAAVLAVAYVMADQFVVEIPAPARGEMVSTANAAATTAPATAVGTVAAVQTDATAAATGAPSEAVVLTAAAAQGDPMPETRAFDLGRPALPEEVATWDIDVRPDGTGLPEGKGDVWTGETVFADNCAVCHGDFGEAVGRWPVLAGGHGSLTADRPVKTIGSYWPYLSTVWDYVYRAMPFGNAQSLTPDEVYAITAYLLYVNDVVDDDFELSHENFTDVRLPNEENFFMDDREQVEYAAFSEEPCMSNCKESVEITGRAAVIDVTPDDAAARKKREEAAMKASADSGVTEVDAGPVKDDESAGEGVQVAAAGGSSGDAELIAAGEKAFKKCAACHAVGDGAKNKAGPQLNAIVGRKIGVVDGFKYSKVMQEAHDEGRVWDEEALAAFLEKPKGYMKGTKMAFAGFRKQDDIDAVIAYLKSFDG